MIRLLYNLPQMTNATALAVFLKIAKANCDTNNAAGASRIRWGQLLTGLASPLQRADGA
jgi:hypothetical protein